MSYPISSDAVKELSGWAPTGDIIDHSWYQNIRRGEKPYYQAIILLGRIVYMYRPVAVRDPVTQLVIGYQQKFESDLWQQSRASLAAQHGISKNDVDDALAELKCLGIIYTELRTINVKGHRLSNVMYIGLNTLILKAISTPIVLQTDSYLALDKELSSSRQTAVHLKAYTNTKTSRKIKRKSSSKEKDAATISPSASETKTLSIKIEEAIALLPIEIRRDARLICQEDSGTGEEIIESNLRYMADRINLTGGLLRLKSAWIMQLHTVSN